MPTKTKKRDHSRFSNKAASCLSGLGSPFLRKNLRLFFTASRAFTLPCTSRTLSQKNTLIVSLIISRIFSLLQHRTIAKIANAEKPVATTQSNGPTWPTAAIVEQIITSANTPIIDMTVPRDSACVDQNHISSLRSPSPMLYCSPPLSN